MSRSPGPLAPATAWATLDLRIGRVLSAEAFPAAHRPAYKLRVDFGAEVGQLGTSAQVTNYSCAELVGRLVVGAVNLGEKHIAGFRSQFLLLGGLAADGTVHLLGVDPGAQPGDPVS